jgi:hypothetical protein
MNTKNIMNIDSNTPNQEPIATAVVLSSLSQEDRNRIVYWLEQMTYAAAVLQIAKPCPDGLGIPTSVGHLRRFFAQESLLELAYDFDSGVWDEMVERINSNRIDFRTAILKTLQRELLLAMDRYSSEPKRTLQLLDRYVRLRALEFKERKAAQANQQNDESAHAEDQPDDESSAPTPPRPQQTKPLPFPGHKGAVLNPPAPKPGLTPPIAQPTQFKKAS